MALIRMADLQVQALVEGGVVAFPFNTEDGEYLYDTYSNQIVQVGALLQEVVGALCGDTVALRREKLDEIATRRGSAAVGDCLQNLSAARSESNLFGSMPIRFGVAPDMPDPRDDLGRRVSGIILLSITEQCNFRCSYCLYSGDYAGERGHMNVNMTADTAVAAFQKLMPTSLPVIIGFYGGETLLRMDFMEEVAAAARTMRPDCAFSVNTNGYLLSEEVFHRLKAFQPLLVVSLDGPAEVHDRNRLTVGGTGTFDEVYRNLSHIAKIDPEFARTSITINMVVSSLDDLDVLCEFVNHDPLFDAIRFTATFVSQLKLSEAGFDRWGLDQSKIPRDACVFGERGDALSRAWARYRDALLTGTEGPLRFEKYVFDRMLAPLVKRQILPLHEEFLTASSCKLGSRVMVTAAGELVPCEKSGLMPAIGTAKDGFRMDCMDKMKAELAESTDACKRCWALRLCSLCYTSLYGEGGAGTDGVRDSACMNVRKEMARSLRMYQEIREYDPDYFTKTREAYAAKLALEPVYETMSPESA